MPLREVAAGSSQEGKEEAKVDIVAVHGLNPWGNPDHAFDTWRKPKGANGNLWLRDELPKTVPNARIFLYQYDSSPAFGSSKERFVHQANDLLERIHIKRTDGSAPTRPILLLGHSLGGILIKQALVNAHSNARYRPIKEATSGLVFFGTPHAGGKDALVTIGKISAKVASKVMRNPSKDVMEALTKGSLFSDVLQESWRHQLNLYKIVSFYEGIGDIVPRESAVLGLSGDVENQVRLEADHSNVCCFDQSLDDDVDNYEVVAANIKELYKACSEGPKKAKSETDNGHLEAFMSAMKAQGGGGSMKYLADCLRPNPQDYESNDLDYATALHNDVKRTGLHLHVLQNQTIVLQSSKYSSPNAHVNPVNSNGDNAFHTASVLGRGTVWASFFLRQNIQINARNNQGNTVLHLYMSATMDKDERTRVVALILKNRPDANVNIKNRHGHDPLAYAVIQNRYTVIGLLVKAGANMTEPIFEDGNTILHYAVFVRHLPSTQVLVAAGAPVNCTNNEGSTPLILAAKVGSKELMKVLLDEGADIEKRNNEGFGPVEMAVEKGNVGSVELLMERGASLTPPKGSEGPSALHIACKDGNADVVRFLLSKGANVNWQDKQGRTAVHVVKEQLLLEHKESMTMHYMECMGLLEKHGADLDVRDMEGRTPVEVVQDGQRRSAPSE